MSALQELLVSNHLLWSCRMHLVLMYKANFELNMSLLAYGMFFICWHQIAIWHKYILKIHVQLRSHDAIRLFFLWLTPMVMWAIGQREVSATLSKLFLFDAHPTSIGKLIIFFSINFPKGDSNPGPSIWTRYQADGLPSELSRLDNYWNLHQWRHAPVRVRMKCTFVTV